MTTQPLPSTSSATRRRMASSTAISFPPDQLPPEPQSSTLPHTTFTHLTSRDILNADPTSVPSGGSAGTLTAPLDPYAIPQLDEPDHIYMPVSTVVGRVYRRVPREQALRMLAGDGNASEWNVGRVGSGMNVSKKNRTPLSIVFNVRRFALGMMRVVPLILLGMTAMETLLSCTQPILALGPLVQVYSVIARPLAIIFDALLTLLVVVRLVLSVTSTRSPFTIHPVSNPSATPFSSSQSLLEHASLFPPDINKPPRPPPSRLATALYCASLVASAVTFPFADDLDIARNARARGAGARWAGNGSLARWLVGGLWTELPKGWETHVFVWWIAGIVRMATIVAGFLVEVVVKAKGRRNKLG
ncbi:hypothetical protein BCR44DRAFT_90928 [Catenaria anguillulae PL171]|uniref:Uncharacterized protein n=1 Tax=Catenaria anguillulae PL171 TaxID=765915 RepID=A0A1Y2I0A4_9FUNG|nr:hypothetical protein BCR44DRAFT_90928 [Catenaria anguillulae PL171]